MNEKALDTAHGPLPRDDNKSYAVLERLRQYAEIALAVALRIAAEKEGDEVLLTASSTRARVSPGSEVEPQHPTTQYEQ
jgi:hypothetical protein